MSLLAIFEWLGSRCAGGRLDVSRCGVQCHAAQTLLRPWNREKRVEIIYMIFSVCVAINVLFEVIMVFISLLLRLTGQLCRLTSWAIWKGSSLKTEICLCLTFSGTEKGWRETGTETEKEAFMGLEEVSNSQADDAKETQGWWELFVLCKDSRGLWWKAEG